MKIHYAERARRDLAHIAAYLMERNPRGADRVGAAIRRSVDRLTLYPLSGRLQDGSGNVRKLVVPAFGYLVYYRIESDAQVMILTVRHAAQERLFEDR